MNKHLKEWFEDNEESIWCLAKELWENPRVAYEESDNCQTLKRFFENHDFTVETFNIRSADGKPNGLKASRGNGNPVIGIMGELDALPDLGQRANYFKDPIAGAGHGCGHNLIAAGCAASAVATSYILSEENLNGTIVYLGCPAEETISGKVLMASLGYFNSLDVCLTWHPGSGPGFLLEFAGTALTNIIYEFHGKTAHAADNAYMGRSALDAAELLNIGSNYLREHVTKDVSFHYSYLSAGTVPNIVPDYASVNYYIRANTRKSCDQIVERITKIAEGAALMTETTMNISSSIGCYEYLVNHRLNRAAYEAWKKIPPIIYDSNDKTFSMNIYKNIHGTFPKDPESLLQNTLLPPKGVTDTTDCGSTDVADVTHICPTVNLFGFGIVGSIPGHHWGVTACAGSSLGKKGMLYSAKGLSQLCFDLLEDPCIINECQEEFQRSRAKMEPYKSRI